MRRRFTLFGFTLACVVVMLLLVMLVGCGQQHTTTVTSSAGGISKIMSLSSRETSESVGAGDYIIRITMDNGLQLLCIENPSGEAVGIDCNWQQFNKDSGR